MKIFSYRITFTDWGDDETGRNWRFDDPVADGLDGLLFLYGEAALLLLCCQRFVCGGAVTGRMPVASTVVCSADETTELAPSLSRLVCVSALAPRCA